MADYLALAENFQNFAQWQKARRRESESSPTASAAWIERRCPSLVCLRRCWQWESLSPFEFGVGLGPCRSQSSFGARVSHFASNRSRPVLDSGVRDAKLWGRGHERKNGN
jgi:hypothetical protein